MTQAAFLRAFDVLATGAFKSASIADRVHYTPAVRGAAAIECTALVDSSLEAFGLDSRVATQSVVISLQLDEVGTVPRSGARVEVLDAAGLVTATYTVVESLPQTDESMAVMLCKVGT
jgi:hypothetical protein